MKLHLLVLVIIVLFCLLKFNKKLILKNVKSFEPYNNLCPKSSYSNPYDHCNCPINPGKETCWEDSARNAPYLPDCEPRYNQEAYDYVSKGTNTQDKYNRFLEKTQIPPNLPGQVPEWSLQNCGKCFGKDYRCWADIAYHATQETNQSRQEVYDDILKACYPKEMYNVFQDKMKDFNPDFKNEDLTLGDDLKKLIDTEVNKYTFETDKSCEDQYSVTYNINTSSEISESDIVSIKENLPENNISVSVKNITPSPDISKSKIEGRVMLTPTHILKTNDSIIVPRREEFQNIEHFESSQYRLTFTKTLPTNNSEPSNLCQIAPSFSENSFFYLLTMDEEFKTMIKRIINLILGTSYDLNTDLQIKDLPNKKIIIKFKNLDSKLIFDDKKLKLEARLQDVVSKRFKQKYQDTKCNLYKVKKERIKVLVMLKQGFIVIDILDTEDLQKLEKVDKELLEFHNFMGIIKQDKLPTTQFDHLHSHFQIP